MRPGHRLFIPFVLLLFLAGLWLASRGIKAQDGTWLELTDVETGRRIASKLLSPGDVIVLTWKNSLFRLKVTEFFVARGGVLEQTGIVFSDPRGGEPPSVRPEDVDDLYHTGGPFKVEGLSRPVRRVIFRVGEIGDPRIEMGGQSVRLISRVGFGGAVLLEARRPTFLEGVLPLWGLPRGHPVQKKG
jgi:hypothetical protein